MAENKATLSPPWYNFFNKIKALFEKDEDVNVEFDNKKETISIYVDNDRKAVALTTLLPSARRFGNVLVKINVIPANCKNSSTATLYEAAFEGNPAVDYIKEIELSPGSLGANYVVFRKEVVQWFNDDLSDINGVNSTLYEDIARDIFRDNGDALFCTNVE